jgi:hypothetical protein
MDGRSRITPAITDSAKNSIPGAASGHAIAFAHGDIALKFSLLMLAPHVDFVAVPRTHPALRAQLQAAGATLAWAVLEAGGAEVGGRVSVVIAAEAHYPETPLLVFAETKPGEF